MFAIISGTETSLTEPPLIEPRTLFADIFFNLVYSIELSGTFIFSVTVIVVALIVVALRKFVTLKSRIKALRHILSLVPKLPPGLS